MKNVFCPKRNEVILIDEQKEKNRQTKYRHRSGKPFEGATVESIGSLDSLDSLESITVAYEEKHNRSVHNRYKNNTERIISKL